MQQIEAHTREIAVHIETIAINFSKFFLHVKGLLSVAVTF